MSDTKDERVERLERAAKEWHAAWVAEPALEVIGERDQRIADMKEAWRQDEHEWRQAAQAERQRAEAAERRVEVLERALWGVQALIPDRHGPDYDRDVRSLEGVLDSVVKVVNTALYTPSDQPAQDDYPTGPPDSLPAGGHARRLRPTADQPADAGEPEHRATLAVVPDGYYGWNVTEDSRIVSGPHRSQADAVEAMRARARRTDGDTP